MPELRFRFAKVEIVDCEAPAPAVPAYMGAINGCEAWSGFLAGQLAERFDYFVAFVAVALASLIALPLLGRISAAGSGVKAAEGR